MQLSLLLTIGLVLTWVGERIVENANAHYALTCLGVAAVSLSVIARFVRASRESVARAQAQRTFALLQLGTLVSLILYLVQSDVFTKLTGASFVSNWPKLGGALSVLWVCLLVVTLFPTVLMEMAYATMAKAPRIEDGRMREAMLTGVGLACALIFAFCAQYVATERDAKADFSYFRVAKAGDATLKLVASFDEPLEVYLFFPPASDAAEAVEGYFKDLAAASSRLTITRLDHALEPLKAKDLGVSGNGTVLFKKGGRKESIFIGTEVEKARTQLRGLDAEVQKRLLQVGKSRRTVYVTGGHGERSQEPTNGMDQRSTIEVLSKTLQDQNFEVRTLTTAEGLGQEVPNDAAAVFIIGPTQAFSKPEADALVAYGNKGGRLFIAVDPESNLNFEELLSPLGLSFTPQNIAQERGNANIRPPPGLADRINIGARTFSSHPVVTYLGRSNAPLLLLGAGGVEELPQHPSNLSVDIAVRAATDAWNDANRNFQFDSAESRKAWGVVAAVERRSANNKPEEAMRALVLGDSDGVADMVIQQLPGNQYLVLDGFKWLLGDEQLSGITNSEVDVPMSRSRQQDSAWFYGTTFLAPLGVIGVGFMARRRTKKPTKTSKETVS